MFQLLKRRGIIIYLLQDIYSLNAGSGHRRSLIAFLEGCSVRIVKATFLVSITVYEVSVMNVDFYMLRYKPLFHGSLQDKRIFPALSSLTHKHNKHPFS